MKLTNLEQLLSLEVEADIELYSIALNTIEEYSRLYKYEVETTNTNVWVTIRKGKVTVTLNSVAKTWK